MKKRSLAFFLVIVFVLTSLTNVFAENNYVDGELTGSGMGKYSDSQKKTLRDATREKSGQSMKTKQIASITNKDSKPIRFDIAEENFLVGEYSLRLTLTNAEWAYYSNTSGKEAEKLATFPTDVLVPTKYVSSFDEEKDMDGNHETVERISQMKYVAPSGFSYIAKISHENPNEMTIEYKTTSSQKSSNMFIEIPVSVVATNSGQIYCEAYSDNGMIVSQRDIAVKSDVATKKTITTTSEIRYGEDKINLANIVIQEEIAGTIDSNGDGFPSFTVEAPKGYKFGEIKYPSTKNISNNIEEMRIEYLGDSKNKLIVSLFGTGKSSSERVALTLRDIVLEKDGGSSDKDLYLNFENAQGGSYQSAGITPIKLLVAKAENFAFNLAVDEVKEMYNGDKKFIKGGTVTLSVEEPLPLTWNVDRETEYRLTDEKGNLLNGVRFVEATITSRNFSSSKNPDVNALTPSSKNIDGRQRFNRDANTLIIKDNVANAASDKLKTDVKFTISADLGFTGDVYINVAGPAVPTNGNDGSANFIKVATVKPKVTVKTTTNVLQLGAKTYELSEVTITEAEAGLLKPSDSGEGIVLRLSDGNVDSKFQNVRFDTFDMEKNLKVDGDIRLKLHTAIDNRIELRVDKESTKPSSITFTNLKLLVGKDPFTYYSLAVEGKALRSNKSVSENTADNSSDFWTSGIKFDKYIDFSPESSLAAMRREIKIFGGSKKVLVDGVESEMEVPAIHKEGRLFVPIRFISQYLGAKDTDVIYDSLTGNATISLGNRVVTFTKDSEYYTSHTGAKVPMNENGVITKAFNAEGRMYIPFRYVANAFGIEVGYDAATKAAIYNPK